jgi:hypothetical protein
MWLLRPFRLVGRELERVRNVRRFSRAPRHWPSWPRALLWSAVLIASIALLLALGYYAGKSSPGGSGFWDSLRRTIVKPSVSLPLAFAILTCLAYACRRVRLEWLAWRPGRIRVPDFSAPDIKSASAQQLTDTFRERLGRMRLASSVAAPGAQPESDFIDVLGSGGASSSNILGTLLGLLRAAVPSFAYELRGVIVERPGPPHQYRVSLQIDRLPNQGSTQVDVADPDLDQVIRRAADFATAAILPRTRLCRGPWIAWRRYAMPGELFNAYEDACDHEARRRYDLAHELYYRALEYDPMNMMLRLQLGQLHEKLNMFLEALVTYTAMDFVATPADGNLPAGLYSRRAERERTRALLLARYRRAVLLAEGSFVDDWYDGTVQASDDAAQSGDQRAVQQRALRNQLLPWLEKRLAACGDGTGVTLLRRSAKGERLGEGQRQALHRALSQCAKCEIAVLGRKLPLGWRLARRPPLTARALALTALCIAERGRVAPPMSGSPKPVADLAKDVRKIEKPCPRFRRQTLRRWEEQYNAGCLFAIALLDESKDKDAAYAKAAIDRLERAAASADSSFIARQRDWVATEDPDLDGLRRLSAFKAFEAQYFPAGKPVARRPTEEQDLVEVRCTRDLLVAAARAREGIWRARAAGAHTPGVGEQWWKDEQEVWRRVRAVAVNCDWRARLELVDAARGWQEGNGRDRVEPVFTRYERDALQVMDDDVDQAARNEIAETGARLSAVARAITGPRSTSESFHVFTWGISVLELYDAEPAALAPHMRVKLCAHQAAVWRAVHRWLELAEGRGERDHGRSFDLQLKRAQRLWLRAGVNVNVRRVLRGEAVR